MKESKGYALTSFGMYEETLGTLRASGGDRGGGSEMLIIEQHLSDVRLYDDGISPTLNTATGGGEYR